MEKNYIEVCDFESLKEAVDAKKEVIYVSGTPAQVLSFFAKLSPSKRSDIFEAAKSKGDPKTVFDNTYGSVAEISKVCEVTWTLVALVATILAFVLLLVAIFKGYDVEIIPEFETTTTLDDKPKNISKFKVRIVLKKPAKA